MAEPRNPRANAPEGPLVSPSEIRPLVRTALVQAESLAVAARSAYHASPPDFASGARILRQLSDLLRSRGQQLDETIFSGRGGTLPKAWQQYPGGFREFRRYGDAMAIGSVVVVRGWRQPSDPLDELRPFVDTLAKLMTEYRTDFEALPDAPDAMLMAIRSMRITGGGVHVWVLEMADAAK